MPDDLLKGRLCANAGGDSETWSLYVHVPFCRSKCPYCAFFSFRPRPGQTDSYTEALCRELRRLKERLPAGTPLSTLYFGGGTPSMLSEQQWRRILETLRIFDRASGCEFTVEGNPESITPEKLRLWKAFGVNRLSVGVQSLNDRELSVMCRPHSAADALRTVESALAAGFRVSADLIFGLPGQSLRSWGGSLRGIVGAGIRHLSVYQLMIEEESFWGKNTPENLPDGYASYRWAQYFLPKKGLKQYEIASFAAPGEESRHNLCYWKRSNVMAAGPGAWGFERGLRYSYARDLDAWLDASARGTLRPDFSERLEGMAEVSEAAVLALRTDRGILYESFAKRYGTQGLQAVLERLMGLPERYFRRSSSGVALSPAGMRVGNAIWSDLMDLEP